MNRPKRKMTGTKTTTKQKKVGFILNNVCRLVDIRFLMKALHYSEVHNTANIKATELSSKRLFIKVTIQINVRVIKTNQINIHVWLSLLILCQPACCNANLN